MDQDTQVIVSPFGTAFDDCLYEWGVLTDVRRRVEHEVQLWMSIGMLPSQKRIDDFRRYSYLLEGARLVSEANLGIWKFGG